MNAISYSIFGYNIKNENCYKFESYLMYFTLVIRMNKLLYPGWINVLNIDKNTYESEYKPIFDHLLKNKWIHLNVHESEPICKAMLWRLEPIFMGYDNVLCRDVDSIACYKESAAVQVWMDLNKKALHAITDSISHNITLMGGMIGIKSDWLKERLNANTWEELINKRTGLDYSIKGADQDFLNSVILPKVSDSITEHYFLGMPQSFRGHCFVGEHIVDHIEVKDISPDLKETNDLVSHIGQSGFILEPVIKFFERRGILDNDIAEIEKQFKEVYHWWLKK